MSTLVLLAAALGLFAVVLLWPRPADAHCDTLDGPAVADGRAALSSGNLNHALKWVGPEAEAELREVFEAVLRVRGQGAAAGVADRLFLETLVRLHRAGEGAGFDGLKPSGTPVDPAVAAAEAALATGTTDPLAGLVPDDRLGELERLLQHALALKGFGVDDLAAGRRYLAAYVDFVHSVEAGDHEPGDHAGHDHAAAHRH